MPDDETKQPPQDLEELARRYVDLWQDQMTALAADPEFAESLQKVMAAMGVAASGLPAMWSGWPAALASVMAAAQPAGAAGASEEKPSNDGQPAGSARTASRKPATPPGAAAAADASHGGGSDLGVLEERLAALEQRIAALEGGTGGTRRRAKGKSQRR